MESNCFPLYCLIIITLVKCTHTNLLKETCQLQWSSDFHNPNLQVFNPNLIVGKTKILGQESFAVFNASSIHKEWKFPSKIPQKTFTVRHRNIRWLINRKKCSLSWTSWKESAKDFLVHLLVSDQFKLSLGKDSDEHIEPILIKRDFDGQVSIEWASSSQSITNLETILFLSSFGPVNNLSTSASSKQEVEPLASVSYPGTEVIRNKSNATVVQELIQEYLLHTLTTQINTAIDENLQMVTKPTILYKQNNFTDWTQINGTALMEAGRRISVPKDTTIMACSKITLQAPQLPPEALPPASSKANILLAFGPSQSSTYAVLPKNGRKRCYHAFLQQNIPPPASLGPTDFVSLAVMESYLGAKFI